MDEAVNPRALEGWFLLAALCGGAAQAQALSDPTRPPAILAPAQAGAALSGSAPSGPQLQSVLISKRPGGRHVAVIDGQTVRLGQEFMGAVLTSMTENEVVLVNGRERQVLRLFPASATTPSRPCTDSAATRKETDKACKN